MSGTMLHGVLNMPPELWSDTELDKMQRYSRYMEASRRIEELERGLNDLLNDCINFDGGKLTDSIMKQASDLLKDS